MPSSLANATALQSYLIKSCPPPFSVYRFPAIHLELQASNVDPHAPTHLLTAVTAKGFFIAADASVVPHFGGLQATWMVARKLLLASRVLLPSEDKRRRPEVIGGLAVAGVFWSSRLLGCLPC